MYWLQLWEFSRIIPWSQINISTTSSIVFLCSIHCSRPSAQATPMLGVVKPMTRKIWHPIWGLWLVVSNTEAKQHQQQHVGQPAANPKVIKKQPSFAEKSSLNVWHCSSSWQADFWSAHFHHKAQLAVHSWDHVLEGSAHTPSGDTRCGMKTRTSSSRCGPRNQTSLTAKGQLNSCPGSQAT